MNTLGDFPIQASKSIKTSSFPTPLPCWSSGRVMQPCHRHDPGFDSWYVTYSLLHLIFFLRF
jgi:hypothetical protein